MVLSSMFLAEVAVQIDDRQHRQSNNHKRRVHGYMDSSPGGETGRLPWVTMTPLSTASPSAHRSTDPQEQDLLHVGFKVKGYMRRLRSGWPGTFSAGDTPNYASDSAPDSPAGLQRRIKSRMSSTRHAVMRTPSVRTGCG